MALTRNGTAVREHASVPGSRGSVEFGDETVGRNGQCRGGGAAYRLLRCSSISDWTGSREWLLPGRLLFSQNEISARRPELLKDCFCMVAQIPSHQIAEKRVKPRRDHAVENRPGKNTP